MSIQLRLSEVVTNWDGLLRAFRLRHRLVREVNGRGRDYAKERLDWAIDATNDVRTVCAMREIDLDARLPIRRRSKQTNVSLQ